MKTTRRDFLKSTAALAGAGVLSTIIAKAAARPSILTGIQLYSIREEMGANPLDTLKKLSAMGYKYVEHANYNNRKFYGWTAKEFKKVLKDLGMEMPSGHTVLAGNHWDATKKDFTDAWKYTVEDAATAGQEFVISPWLDAKLRATKDDVKRFMEVFNKAGELCKKSGMKFGYHNHDFEFSEMLDGESLYDLILNYTDPATVMQQLDIGNLYNGGVKAIDIVKKYPGRFESLHVKDMVEAAKSDHGKYESTILGKGIGNVKEVIDLCKNAGSRHFIIEQESYQGVAPLECAKEDLATMKTWSY